MIPALRVLLVTGGLGAVVLAAATARWDGWLTRGGHTWLVDLGRRPIWSPPAAPEYERFRQAFGRDDDFPPPHGCTLGASWSAGEAVLEAVLYLWPVTGLCGVMYLAARGPRRDLVLHCAVTVAAGLTAAVVSCLVLWCVAGGWGPPSPACFGVLGLLTGLLFGVGSFPTTVEYPGEQPGAAESHVG